LLRLIGAIYGNIDLDEGIHLYDAKLINEGLIPFYDFLTREPFYVYSLSVFVKIFGQSLLTSRMVSVVAFTLSAIVIFFLGKRIFDKKVALTAATLFLLSPYLIYNSYLGNLYGTYTLISSLFFLFFAELLLPDKPKKTNLILSGLLLGSAVHFYRIAVFYFPVVGFIWGFYIISKLHKKYFLLFLFSIFLPFILPLIYFSKKVGYGNFEIIYGTNELIISFLSLIIFFLFGVFLKKFFTKLNNDFKNKLISYFILLIIIFILYSFFNIGLDSSKKTKIIADMFLQNWFIFLFILINGLYLINHFSIEESLSSFLRLLIITVLGILLYYGFYESASLNNFGARPIQPALKKIFFWPFLFSLTMTFFITNKKQKFTSEGGIIYWWLIMLSPIIFYTIHVQINVNNFLAFSVLGSIMAAHGFWVTINNFEKLEKNISKTMAVSLLVIFVIPILIYTKIPLRDRLYTQEFKKEIEIYLIKNTKKNEEIFTNALVFPVETGRKSFMNLSRAFIYASSPIYMPEYIGTSSNLLPSNVLADKLRKECDVILMDHRTTAILKTNEYFKDLEDCYYKDKEWIEYGISLWRKDKNLCN
jgi:4-amino-4-deoxy-L-arabinose transferase-like glycosyltransferase